MANSKLDTHTATDAYRDFTSDNINLETLEIYGHLVVH